MATALARQDTTDTCPNSSSVSGTRPTVTAHCVRAAPASAAATTALALCHRPSALACRTGSRAARKIAATAPKDSQKPGDITAHGSIITATPAAHASTTDAGGARPLHNASAATASMLTVRIAGTCIPAISP
ncbi:hypothetical protein D3C86_1769610 [compost metagenome]